MEIFVWGAFGGFCAEAIGIIELRRAAARELPDFLRSWFYWACVAILVGMGGGLAAAYDSSGESISTILAVNIGASAPLLVKGLMGQAPSLTE